MLCNILVFVYRCGVSIHSPVTICTSYVYVKALTLFSFTLCPFSGIILDRINMNVNDVSKWIEAQNISTSWLTEKCC
jgi:hypothetical protein